MNKTSQYRLPRPGVALSLLGCLFLFCLILAGIIIPMLQRIIQRPEAALRIATIVQDLLVFILPAIGMAMVVTRLPARLLAIDNFPSIKSLLLSTGILIASIPAMNWVIQWNQNWHLPASMASAEAFFRQLEDSAEAATQMLMANSTVASLLLSILIVGVLAGFSEELFFRGALQRILSMTKINHHVAIWLVAFIFSAFHIQLFGFVPRLLLGAFFGYLLYWSGSLWLPIILHIFNNTLVVIAEYNKVRIGTDATADLPSLDTIGSSLSSPVELVFVLSSILLTVWGITYLRRRVLL